MSENREAGYIEDVAVGIGITLVILFFLALIFFGLFVKWKPSNEVVSGIVYNTTNDRAISGATQFSVRAAVDTYTDENNASTYCLPAGSQYIPLVNKAAEDKTIKVIVHENKFFGFAAPWVCVPNVTVTEEK